MRLTTPPCAPLLIAAVLTATACGSSAPSAAPSVSDSSPTEADPLVGVIAIGHSGLTGEGTAGRLEAALDNSWATGTNPEVNSVYLRLSDRRPENSGHVANTAQGGAVSDSLVVQAESALQKVPHPLLVIISTIDNDIRCDGSDAEHLPEFGDNVANALTVISTASPDSTILVVGQPGRPSVDFVRTLVAHDPAVKRAMSGSGPCDFFNRDGNLVADNFQTLTGIIDDYETEQAERCAIVPRCHTDGGARAAYVDTLENFSSDWAHLNIRGQAAEAELIWPVVESILEL